MRHHRHSGVIQVEPGRNLTVSYDEDVSHPGGVFLHRAQRIAELLVVLESARRNIFVLLRLRSEDISNDDENLNTQTSLRMYSS